MKSREGEKHLDRDPSQLGWRQDYLSSNRSWEGWIHVIRRQAGEQRRALPSKVLPGKPGGFTKLSHRDCLFLSCFGLVLDLICRVCVKLLQSCLTLCNPMDCSPLGSSVHGILQAWILEWVAVPFSRGSSWVRDGIHVSQASCTGKWVLYSWRHLGSPWCYLCRH